MIPSHSKPYISSSDSCRSSGQRLCDHELRNKFSQLKKTAEMKRRDNSRWHALQHADQTRFTVRPSSPLASQQTVSKQRDDFSAMLSMRSTRACPAWPRRRSIPPYLAHYCARGCASGVRHRVERDFTALERETKWVTDITEIKTDIDKLYVSIVLNLFDHRIVGWSTHHRQDQQIVLRALQMAVWQRQSKKPMSCTLIEAASSVAAITRIT
jgi:hypothetical protein